MSAIKNNPDINLYYSDTDSALVDEYLPSEMVDNKAIGKWKTRIRVYIFLFSRS